MDTREFFNRVLATQGLVCLAEFAPGKKPFHRFYTNHNDAAEAAVALDASGKTIYHACATFATDESRKQENAAYCRSFWVDADVDPENPEKYPDLKTALTDIARVSKELNLPLPLIVRSGAGAHVYWILDADVTAGKWRLVAGRFKSVLEHLRFRQDRTRTADSASVLRPVGTHWRKQGSRRVECLSPGRPISLGEFVSALEGYAARVGSELRGYDGLDRNHRGAGPVFDGAGFDDLGGRPEYPPSSARRISEHCATLRHVADTRGDVEEPLWRAMLGLVKHCVEGVELCHDWSRGHPAYSAAETQEKIDGWKTGPTTCATFRGTNGNKCAGCPHQISSPIHLGYTAELPPSAPPAPAPEDGVVQPAGYAQPVWPRNFGWSGSHMQYLVEDGETGQNKWVSFSDTLWFPVQRVRSEEGVWNLRIRHQMKDKRWHEFELPCELIGAQHGLAAHLAAHEVFLHGKQGVSKAKDLLREYTLNLQRDGVEQVTYAKMGWADEYRAFIIGNRRIGADNELEVLAGDQIRKAGWDKDFGCAGTLEEWKRLVDLIYNRPGAEPYQFAIGCAFAAPLVEITEASNWHGIPVALTGTTGLGKTTTCKVATSIYGHCNNFMVASGKDGATMNAMVSRIGTARNLPLIFDELTDRDSEEVSSFLYMLSSGRPKDRNRADGTIIDLGLNWNTISFITSNKNVTELLFLLDERNVTEATQIRCFEIALSEEDMEIWGDTNAMDLIEHQLLESNYGHAGRVWLRYLIENRGKIRDEVRTLRAKFTPDKQENTRERYYRDLIAAVVIALKHAYKLGLVKFNPVEVAKWAKQNTLKLRRRRAAQSFTSEEYIAHFLHSLHGRTIITKYFKDGRATPEVPMEILRQPPAARMALDDKAFFVLRKAVTDWCAEHKLQVSRLIDEMDKRNMIIPAPNGDITKLERIGKGTNLPSTLSVCYELDYNLVTGMSNPAEGVTK